MKYGKKRGLSALLLCLALLLTVLSGCGTETASVPEADPQPTAETAETTAASEPAEAVEAAEAEPAPEPTPKAEQAEAQGVEFTTESENAGTGRSAVVEFTQPDHTIQYPLDNGSDNTLSLWASFDLQTFEGRYNSQSEFPCMPYMVEQTGVTLELTEVSQTVVTEQYQLMVAAGDYCDLIPTSQYTGEAIQAYADDVIIDLTDLLPENAPNFWARVQTYTAAEQYEGTSDGLWLNMPSLVVSTISDSGYYTRGDWLEALGLEVPTCKADFMEAVYAIYDAYQCEYTINLSTDCAVPNANSWFDVGIYSVGGTDPAMYLDHGTIASGLIQDKYRAYLEWFIGLYNDGLINKDFYAAEQNRDETLNIVGLGQSAFFSGMADHASDYYNYADDPNFALQPLPALLNDEGFVYKEPVAKVGGGASTGGGGSNAPSVSVDCEDPAFAVRWLNWFYTEDGAMFANYGTPGECWNYDEEGNVTYTDLIIHNPEGLNSMQAFTIYGWSLSASYSIGTKFLDTYTDDVREAITLWSDTQNVRYDQTIPNGAGLDADESGSIINQLTDVCAYADEMVLKWIVGEQPLDDASWADWCAMLQKLGLDQIVEVYAKAYGDFTEEFGA